MTFDGAFYDKVFEKIANDPFQVNHTIKHLGFVAKYCVGDVLDLGCGLGLLADMIGDRQYLGVDFSGLALAYAHINIKNPNAIFRLQDVFDFISNNANMYDTIVLSEILEHVEQPEILVNYALTFYRRRIIAVLPIDMPMEGHIKGTWTDKEIKHLFGDRRPLLLTQGCPTPKKRNLHWHIIYEKPVI